MWEKESVWEKVWERQWERERVTSTEISILKVKFQLITERVREGEDQAGIEKLRWKVETEDSKWDKEKRDRISNQHTSRLLISNGSSWCLAVQHQRSVNNQQSDWRKQGEVVRGLWGRVYNSVSSRAQELWKFDFKEGQIRGHYSAWNHWSHGHENLLLSRTWCHRQRDATWRLWFSALRKMRSPKRFIRSGEMSCLSPFSGSLGRMATAGVSREHAPCRATDRGIEPERSAVQQARAWRTSLTHSAVSWGQALLPLSTPCLGYVSTDIHDARPADDDRMVHYCLIYCRILYPWDILMMTGWSTAV